MSSTTKKHNHQLCTPVCVLIITLLLTQSQVRAQYTFINNNFDDKSNSISGSSSNSLYTGITVILLTILFLFVYVLFYYSLNHCFRSPQLEPSWAARGWIVESPVLRGLDQHVIQSFPTFTFSEVMGLRPGKGPLECAVCLSPFEENETLRLLPVCEHVFHPECVDKWLGAHTTCPYCRASLIPQSIELTLAEVNELENVVSRDVNEGDNDGIDAGGRLWRSNSTGHVGLGERLTLEDEERYRLRLSKVVKNDVVGKLSRSKSFCIITID